jgi:hypothetical protein
LPIGHQPSGLGEFSTELSDLNSVLVPCWPSRCGVQSALEPPARATALILTPPAAPAAVIAWTSTTSAGCGGGDQVPLTVAFLQAAQEKGLQTTPFLDLSVHRFNDRSFLRRSLRLAPGIDLAAVLAIELAGPRGSWHRHLWGAALAAAAVAARAGGGRWRCRHHALIDAGLGVVLAPVARIKRHHIR